MNLETSVTAGETRRGGVLTVMLIMVDGNCRTHLCQNCVEVEEVVGVLTPFVGGVAQVFHVLLVELRLLLVAEVEEGEEEEGQERKAGK